MAGKILAMLVLAGSAIFVVMIVCWPAIEKPTSGFAHNVVRFFMR